MSAIARLKPVEDDAFAGLISEAIGRVAFVKIVVPPGPELLWPAIRKIGDKGSFTIRQVASAVGCAPSVVETYMAKLHAGGFVAIAGDTADRQRLWYVAMKRALEPVVDGRGNPSHGHEVARRVWQALRMGKSLSLAALVAAISDPDFAVPRETASLYVRALARAGYVEEIEAAKSCGELRYRLVPSMVKGPRPPRLMRASLVYDPNIGAIAGGTIHAEEVRL